LNCECDRGQFHCELQDWSAPDSQVKRLIDGLKSFALHLDRVASRRYGGRGEGSGLVRFRVLDVRGSSRL
jgi:hypothetical protein